MVSTFYEPRCPGAGTLHRIVREHFETFRAQAARLRDGDGLPRFVETEFRDFLRCGSLAGGFARFQCGTCGLDRLVAFSCKGRGVCPSCGGRRMAERAAHLVDHVLPDVPIRQWVLSLPYRLRYRLAWDHDLCRVVVAVFVRAVLRCLRARACEAGVGDARGGAVAVVQRFGGALNLNVHVHALVLDGVFAPGAEGAVAFHPAPPLTTLDIAEVLQTVDARLRRLLERRGLGEGEADATEGDVWAEEAPGLAGLAAASVQGHVALGRDRGTRVRRLGDEAEEEGEIVRGGCHARANGFDLHAGLVVPAGDRARLERVCRYALRPPVAGERLSLSSAGQVLVQFRRPWRDGTTHLTFDPIEFLGRLAVLVPRPRINLLLYHGVLAPRAAWRSAIVPRPVSADGGVACSHEPTDTTGRHPAETPNAEGRRARGRVWADLMQRTFGLDVLGCPRCGGRLRLIALIEQAAVIQRILRHLGLPETVPTPSPARAPPLPLRRQAHTMRYDLDADDIEAP